MEARKPTAVGPWRDKLPPLPSPSPLSPLMVMYHIISRSSAAGTRLGSLFEDCLPRSCASSAGAPSSRLVLAWLAVRCCWESCAWTGAEVLPWTERMPCMRTWMDEWTDATGEGHDYEVYGVH